MAERLGKDTDATREHNVKARKDAISEGLEKLYQLDRQIAALMEKHIAGPREDKNKIKADLREAYQIPAALLQARYASYKLERFAEESSDDTTLDIIREMFDALPVGGSVDLVEAAERGAEEDDGQSFTVKAANTYEAGRKAGKAGKNLDTCLHKGATVEAKKLRVEWERGWSDGQEENLPSGPRANGSEAHASA